MNRTKPAPLNYTIGVVLVVVLTVILMLFLGTGRTEAISNQFPSNPAGWTFYCNPNISCGTGTINAPMYATVGSGAFNSNKSFAKIHSSSTNVTLTIHNAGISECAAQQNYDGHNNQSIDIINTNFFTQWRLKNSSNVVINNNLYASNNAVNGGCAPQLDASMSINLPASTFNASTGYYEAVVEAELIIFNAGAVNENSFRYSVSSGSYIGVTVDPSGAPGTYGFSNRNVPLHYVKDYSTEFSLRCGVGSRPATIGIWDADNGSLQNFGNYPTLGWTLQRRNRGSAGGYNSFASGITSGRQNGLDNVNFFADVNFEYNFILQRISRPNAAELIMPNFFDSYPVGTTCNPPRCTITNIVRFADNNPNIRPGDRIKFKINIQNANGWTLGVNGPGFGNEYGSTNIDNYLATGSTYRRGPRSNSNNYTTTVTAITNVDGGDLNQAMNAPGSGSYPFSWGLVIPGFGWLPVTCTGSFNVAPTDLCANISGNQAKVPNGYTQSGANCVLVAPTCTSLTTSPGTVSVGKSFTFTITLKNSTSIGIDITNVTYSSSPAGISGSMPGAANRNIAAGTSSKQTYTSGNKTVSTPGNYVLTIPVTYNTLYGAQTINVSCSTSVGPNRITVTIEPLECTGLSFPAEVGVPITVSVNVTNSNSVQIPVSASSWSITPTAGVNPNNGVGAKITGGPSLNASGGGYNMPANENIIGKTFNSNNVTLSNTGTYTVTWTITASSGGSSVSCSDTGTISVTASPYVRFYGNDVIAGGGFGSCATTASTTAAVRAKGRFGSGTALRTNWKGSASELAVFATTKIQGLLPGSQVDRSVSGTDILKQLSFANNVTLPTPYPTFAGTNQFGGGFGGTSCVDDYWANKPAGIPDIPPSKLSNDNYLATVGVKKVNLATLASGTYLFTGELHLYADAAIPVGRRITIYVDGTTVLGRFNGGLATERIAYDTTWASIDEIPLLRVITKGNVFIDDNVVQLDGLFVAQPTGAVDSGEIHTCSFFNDNLNLRKPTLKELTIATNCGNQLVVNGAFVAKRVHLLRIPNTVNDSVLSFDGNGASTTAAEVFRFSPELYLALLSEGAESTNKFDSLLSLPPAF